MNGSTKKTNQSPNEKEIEKIKELINSNQLSNAENEVSKLIKKYPYSIKLLNILGVTLIAQEKLTDAENIYLKILDIKPDYAEGLNNIANIYMKKNNDEKAIYFFEKALSIKPSLNQTNFNLAKIYTKSGDKSQISGDFDDSIKKYELAIKYKPDFVEALNNKGVSLQRLNKIDDAKKIFIEAIKINPKDSFTETNINL